MVQVSWMPDFLIMGSPRLLVVGAKGWAKRKQAQYRAQKKNKQKTDPDAQCTVYLSTFG